MLTCVHRRAALKLAWRRWALCELDAESCSFFLRASRKYISLVSPSYGRAFYGHASHGRAFYGHASHGRAFYGHASHGRAFYGHASHGRASHERASLVGLSRGPLSRACI